MHTLSHQVLCLRLALAAHARSTHTDPKSPQQSAAVQDMRQQTSEQAQPSALFPKEEHSCSPDRNLTRREALLARLQARTGCAVPTDQADLHDDEESGDFMLDDSALLSSPVRASSQYHSESTHGIGEGAPGEARKDTEEIIVESAQQPAALTELAVSAAPLASRSPENLHEATPSARPAASSHDASVAVAKLLEVSPPPPSQSVNMAELSSEAESVQQPPSRAQDAGQDSMSISTASRLVPIPHDPIVIEDVASSPLEVSPDAMHDSSSAMMDPGSSEPVEQERAQPMLVESDSPQTAVVSPPRVNIPADEAQDLVPSVGGTLAAASAKELSVQEIAPQAQASEVHQHVASDAELASAAAALEARLAASDEFAEDISDDAIRAMEDEIAALERQHVLDAKFEGLDEDAILELADRKARSTQGLNSDNVSDVQELLSLLGLPYLVATDEAECECAALEQAGVVSAVFTDDSDALLFGARHVVRNIFGHSRPTTRIDMRDVETHLGESERCCDFCL
jgi:hypothetical protein